MLLQKEKATRNTKRSTNEKRPRTRPVRHLVETISPHVVPEEERSLWGTPAQRWRAGTTWAGVEGKGSGVVGARGLPSLALAARSTVEGRPYMGIAVLGGFRFLGALRFLGGPVLGALRFCYLIFLQKT
ncbi:hypothetical protein KDH_76220 [Dictyobacter sp. S3.2.2.5]|uniref:Uncharacterized protein n=1 Tax=Dictyobacter halimunensis TaxID=3026934 RepID=A0ABQ6G2P0_9CHLR|nr:hypothetical protein KDH_76220 [Dictyobacter sp. S3.2.2.5]